MNYFKQPVEQQQLLFEINNKLILLIIVTSECRCSLMLAVHLLVNFLVPLSHCRPHVMFLRVARCTFETTSLVSTQHSLSTLCLVWFCSAEWHSNSVFTWPSTGTHCSDRLAAVHLSHTSTGTHFSDRLAAVHLSHTARMLAVSSWDEILRNWNWNFKKPMK